MITAKEGNLLDSGCDIICHQVNCKGVMGSGLAKQVKEKFPEVYNCYLQSCSKKAPSQLLGHVDIVVICNKKPFGVANLYAQDGYGTDKQYTDYKALESCLNQVKLCADCHTESCRIGLPYKLGCGLAGGNWEIVYNIINKVFEQSKHQVEIWRI